MHLLSILDNIDVYKILGYGLTGLSLLFVFFAYKALQIVIQQTHPTPVAASLTKLYFGLTLAALVIVGLFSIPIAGNNSSLQNKASDLTQKNNTLQTETKKLDNQNKALVYADEIKSLLDSISQSSNINEAKTDYKKVEVLSKKLNEVAPEITPAFTEATKQLHNKILTINNGTSAEPPTTTLEGATSKADNIKIMLDRNVVGVLKRDVLVKKNF